MTKKCPRCGKEYENANTLCPVDGTVLEKADNDDPLLGQTLADKYRIEELINEGGMGAVYRATHVLMDKTVAVKVLHPALAADDKIVARFSREARAASRISHPHALSVTDFGEDKGGVVFLVMEYLKGETLKEVIRKEGPMPLPRTVEIIRQVCGALEAAHSEGVVHRDLKSDNIMLIDVGGGDWAKVLDFGIAKITEKVGQDPALTAPNLIIGTPQYMSPEQCSQAAEIDSRSDIYSLGVILYELLIGHVPFTGESPTAIMMKHLQEPPPSVLEERKDLPASVGRVVTRAMAKRPEDRYQTVSELTEEFTAAAADKPAAAAASTTGPASSDRSTNRIVVPTGSNEAPRSTASEDHDEATVVRPRPEPEQVVESEIFSTEVVPPESFSPWRIVIPAIAGLLVIFAIVFALTRNSTSQPASNNNSQPLTVDPGGQPVQPAQTPTGAGERDIAPSTTPSTSPEGNVGIVPEPNLNKNKNTGAPDKNANGNGNDNAEPSENSNEDETQPTPSPNKNANQRRELPKPNIKTPDANPDEPPPLPTPKALPTPKPSSSGDGAPQSPGGQSSNPLLP